MTTNDATLNQTRMLRHRNARLWWDDLWGPEAGAALGSENFYTENMVYLPFYLDTVELGQRASDWLHGPAEEQLLEDMIANDLNLIRRVTLPVHPRTHNGY